MQEMGKETMYKSVCNDNDNMNEYNDMIRYGPQYCHVQEKLKW